MPCCPKGALKLVHRPHVTLDYIETNPMVEEIGIGATAVEHLNRMHHCGQVFSRVVAILVTTKEAHLT